MSLYCITLAERARAEELLDLQREYIKALEQRVKSCEERIDMLNEINRLQKEKIAFLSKPPTDCQSRGFVGNIYIGER